MEVLFTNLAIKQVLIRSVQTLYHKGANVKTAPACYTTFFHYVPSDTTLHPTLTQHFSELTLSLTNDRRTAQAPASLCISLCLSDAYSSSGHGGLIRHLIAVRRRWPASGRRP